MDDTLWENLLRAVASVCDAEPPVTPTRTTRFREDLGLASLDLISVVFELEERYDVNLAKEVPERLQTLGEAYDLIAGVLARPKPEIA